MPLLAGLAEVMPWVRQWHGEVDPAFGQSPADAYDDYLDDQREVRPYRGGPARLEPGSGGAAWHPAHRLDRHVDGPRRISPARRTPLVWTVQECPEYRRTAAGRVA